MPLSYRPAGKRHFESKRKSDGPPPLYRVMIYTATVTTPSETDCAEPEAELLYTPRLPIPRNFRSVIYVRGQHHKTRSSLLFLFITFCFCWHVLFFVVRRWLPPRPFIRAPIFYEYPPPAPSQPSLVPKPNHGASLSRNHVPVHVSR